MNSAFQKDIDHGRSAFEDLHLLADPQMIPLIGRAYHHFSEVASLANQKNLLAELPVLRNFIEKNLDFLLQEFFKTQTYSLYKDETNLEVSHWEKILSVLPDVLQVIACFQFRGDLKIELTTKGLYVRAHIVNGQSLKDHRLTIYKAFRKLLAKQSLLTFEVKESLGSFETELTLWADITHDENLVFAFDKLFGFSNILENYQVSLEELGLLGDHTIIEIGSDYQVSRRETLPDNFKSLFSSSHIIHFHFLFRPISLIIGAKGKILPRHALCGTGSGLYGTSQEVGKLFDIFSLLSM